MLLGLMLVATAARGAAPEVTNVVMAQRLDGSGLVDITYDVADADGDTLAVAVQFSADGGLSWDFPSLNLSGDIGAGVLPGVGRSVIWNAGSIPELPVLQDLRVRVVASDAGVVHEPHSPRNVAITDFSAIDWNAPGNIEKYARADLLQLMGAELWPGGPFGDAPIIAQMKEINPDLKVVAYVSAKTAQLSGASALARPFWHEWYKRTKPFWVYTTLGDTASDFPGNVIVNILNPACRDTMVGTIVEFQRSSLNRFDGVYWDYFNRALWVHGHVDAEGDPDMDGDGIGHWNDPDEMAAYRAAQVAMIAALRDSLGSDFIQIFNGQRAYSDSTFAALGDGGMYEIFPTLLFPDPDMQHALDPNYVYSLFNARRWFREQNGGPYLVLANTWQNYYYDHNNTVQQLILGDVFRAAAMVADCYSSWHTNDLSPYSNTYAWTDNDISVGQPLGPPTFEGPFIRRDFQYGKVEIEMGSGRYPDAYDYRIWSLGQIVEELAIPYHYP